MATAPAPHRPNPLFNLVGVVLIVGGIALTIYGLAMAAQTVLSFSPFRGGGPPYTIADHVALAFWGIIVFTIGRYIWRGARTRGARDRTGRFLLIGGYILLGIALDRGVHAAVKLWAARSSDAMESAVLQAAITFAVWAIPAAVLAAIGVRMASERYLATAEMNAGM